MDRKTTFCGQLWLLPKPNPGCDINCDALYTGTTVESITSRLQADGTGETALKTTCVCAHVCDCMWHDVLSIRGSQAGLTFTSDAQSKEGSDSDPTNIYWVSTKFQAFYFILWHILYHLIFNNNLLRKELSAFYRWENNRKEVHWFAQVYHTAF